MITGSSWISTDLSQWILSFQSLALGWHSRLQQWVLMPGCAGDNSLPDRWITELWSRRLIRPVMTLWWMDFLSPELEPWAVLELRWIGSRTLGFQLLSRGEHSEDPSGSFVLCQKKKEIRYFFSQFFFRSALLVWKTNSSVVEQRSGAECSHAERWSSVL